MKIGIIGAMGEEVVKLIAMMDKKEESTRAGMIFYSGCIGETPVTVVQSGIGKVNMAMCAQILIDLYGAEALINTGVGGALDPRLDVGDVVIGRDAVQHDMDATAFGDPLGQVPRMDTWAFPCDEKLGDLAYTLNRQVNPRIHTYYGRIASGDQFVADAAKKTSLVKEFQASCCEMEGVAMAQTAYRNGIPCLILRAISDRADGNALISYEEFLEKAVDHLVALLANMLPKLA